MYIRDEADGGIKLPKKIPKTKHVVLRFAKHLRSYKSDSYLQYVVPVIIFFNYSYLM